MINRRQLLAYSTAGAATAALATGCSSDEGDGSVTLNFAFWGDTDRADKYNQAIELFQKANPTITVKPSYAAFANYWQQRSTEAAGSSLPDVFQMDLAYISQYGLKNQLKALDEYLGNGIDTSAVNESVVSAGALNGATYGIPLGTNAFCIQYNSTLVEELGVAVPEGTMTWADYHAWIEELSAAGAKKSTKVYGSTDHTGVFWTFIHSLRQQGKEPFTADGALNFTEAELSAWWGSVAAMRGTSLMSAKEDAGYSPETGFTKSRSAMIFNWDNQLAGVTAQLGEDVEVKLLALPTDTASSGLFYKASMLLSIGQNSSHPEEAAKFIDFIINDAEVGKIFGTSRGIPVTQAQRDAVEADTVATEVMEYEDSIADGITAFAVALPEGFGTLETEFTRLGGEVNYGNATPDDAAKQWFESAAEALAS